MRCSGSCLPSAALADRELSLQVEGFPPPTEVKTIFMATDIHADDSDMTVIDYVLADTVPSGTRPAGQLKGVPHEQAVAVLDSVGFVKNDKDYTGEGAR